MDTGLPFRSVQNDTAAYVSLKAESRQIRCVSIAPGYGSSPLVCHLTYASLAEAERGLVQYEALSYCWGNLSTVVPITLVHPEQPGKDQDKPETLEQTFFVTTDLHSALMNFRRTLTARTLWIDAICINQNDPVERSQQVSSMGQIFSAAERVLVWLGEGNIDSNIVLDVMDIYYSRLDNGAIRDPKIKLSNLLDTDRDWFLSLPQKFSCLRTWRHWDLPESKQDPATHTASDLEKKYGPPAAFWLAYTTDVHLRRNLISAHMIEGVSCSPTGARERFETPSGITSLLKKSLDGMFSRPWFKRVWVIQEVFRAPLEKNGQPKVTVNVGDRSANWEKFCNFMDYLAEREATMNAATYHFPMVSDDPSGLEFFKTSWLSLWQRGVMDRERSIPILHVLEWTSKFQASDLRDKVYAILELGSDTRGDNMSHPLLRPDYLDKCADDAMFDFVRWHMQTKRTLDLLNFFPGFRPKQSLGWGLVPRKFSWVPDLIRTGADWPFVHFIQAGYPGFLEAKAERGDIERVDLLDLSFSFRDSSFLIAGVILSRVKRVFQYRHASGTSFTIGRQFHELFTFIRNNMCSWEQEPQGAIFLERAVRMFGILESEHDMHVGFIQYLKSKKMVGEDPDDAPWKTFCKRNNYHRDREDHDLLWNRFEHRMNNFHRDRRLFITNDGTPGLGPEFMQEDDIVVGLYTGKTPYVLRPCGQKGSKASFLMLGPCLLYDQKPMDDERYIPKNGQEIQLFEML